jgi:hypothetical protein
MDSETRRLLEREAGRIHVPLGAYARNLLVEHAHSLENAAKSGCLCECHGAIEESEFRATEAIAIGSNEQEKVSDGRPTYRLTHDRGRSCPWMVGPYLCFMQLLKRESKKQVELWLKIFNGRYRLDEWGNPAMRVSTVITSNLCGFDSVNPASSYEEAVSAVNAHKFRAEELLHCNLDLSALDNAEELFVT